MAAKQSNLEKVGLERRRVELTRSDYSKNDQYSASHKDAISDGDVQGKGTNSGGHTYSIPNYELGKDRIIPQIDTKNGGGKYDIEGYNGVGGRRFLTTINMYNEDNQYGVDSVDTSVNREDGQYYIR